MLTVNTATQRTSLNGTSLQGYIDCDYETLCKVFGKETSDGDGYKVDAQWELEFSDGTVATIYNWKNGKNYDEDDGLEVSEITDWHIGGHSKQAVANVGKLLVGSVVSLA